MNIHEQVNATPQVIYNCIKEKSSRLPKLMTQHKYLTNVANAIIDDGTGKELNYLQMSNHPKHQKICKKSFVKNLEDYPRVKGYEYRLHTPCSSFLKSRCPETDSKTSHMVTSSCTIDHRRRNHTERDYLWGSI